MTMETTQDRILDGRVILNQPSEGYRAAIDPVFLAASVSVKVGAKGGIKALDMGCGVGAAMLCLATRVPGLAVDGLELQNELAELADKNIAENGLNDRVRVFAGDILNPPAALEQGSYHHVLANPPYMSEDRGNHPPNESKRTAHIEGVAGIGDWVAMALKFCRHKGSVTFIYRADRLAELLIGLEGKAGEITVFPLWPKDGETASRVIVRARKGVKTPMQLASGLTLHNADGRYSDTADAVLKGESLNLRA